MKVWIVQINVFKKEKLIRSEIPIVYKDMENAEIYLDDYKEFLKGEDFQIDSNTHDLYIKAQSGDTVYEVTVIKEIAL